MQPPSLNIPLDRLPHIIQRRRLHKRKVVQFARDRIQNISKGRNILESDRPNLDGHSFHFPFDRHSGRDLQKLDYPHPEI